MFLPHESRTAYFDRTSILGAPSKKSFSLSSTSTFGHAELSECLWCGDSPRVFLVLLAFNGRLHLGSPRRAPGAAGRRLPPRAAGRLGARRPLATERGGASADAAGRRGPNAKRGPLGAPRSTGVWVGPLFFFLKGKLLFRVGFAGAPTGSRLLFLRGGGEKAAMLRHPRVQKTPRFQCPAVGAGACQARAGDGRVALRLGKPGVTDRPGLLKGPIPFFCL